MTMSESALFSSKSDEWSTPQWLFDRLNKVYQFDCDAAATPDNTKCAEYFSSALDYDWVRNDSDSKTFWLNPPYSQIGAFMKKAYEESQKGAVVVCLIPSRTDTKYWHEYVMKAYMLRFVRGRLKFGDSKNSAPFPSVIVIFKQNGPIYTYPLIGKTIEHEPTQTNI